jgi:uncharacterized protein (DUF1919 family)
MSPSRPLVSVVMPAFNAAATLQAALASIWRQHYEALEVLVVDDGSSDATGALAAAEPGVRVLRQQQAGPAAARNRGVAASRGTLIAFLDADDLWAPAMLGRLVDRLMARPEADIVQGLIQRVCGSGDTVGAPDLRPCSAPYRFVNLGSALYRRGLFERVGPFDPRLQANEDTDWMLRAWDAGIEKIPMGELFLHYRQRPDSLTRAGSHSPVGVARLLKHRLDRRRAAAPSAPPRQGIHAFLGQPPPPTPVAFEAPPTILANDCWGGDAYRSLGIAYASPLIGTRVLAPCFLNLLADLPELLGQPLEFIERSRYGFMNDRRQQQPYPLACLGGRVEVHFPHAHDPDAVRAAWHRRCGRVRLDQLFIKFSEDPGVCRQEHLEAFEALPYPYRICITQRAYPGLPSTLSLPDYFHDGAPIFHLTRQRFDVLAWLRRCRGPAVAGYRRRPAQGVLR